MMRRFPCLILGLLVTVCTCFASTEPGPLTLTLLAKDTETLLLHLENRGSRELAVQLELRATAGRLQEEPDEEIRLSPNEVQEFQVRWIDAPEGGRIQARAWELGTTAFVQDRLFRKGRGLVSLEAYLQDSPLRLTLPPTRPLGSDNQVVTGQIAFPTFAGNVEPLARVVVQLQGLSLLTDEQGRFEFRDLPAGPATLQVSTESTRWSIHHPQQSKPYSLSTTPFEIPEEGGLDLGEILLPVGEPVTEAAWIHHVAVLGERFLQTQGDALEWWKKLPISWPDRGDFYSWGSLHISEAHRWDVIGHELGHAIYFGASAFSGGGGSHKIDECYSAGLALSEGWATYFSAAIHLDRADPDARFEFLVPRRAPIRIENVPEDVCPGAKNEWRVAAFFWDLYDTHVDLQDNLDLSWEQASWRVMRSGFPAKGLVEAMEKLQEGLSPELAGAVQTLAEQNQVAPEIYHQEE